MYKETVATVTARTITIQRLLCSTNSFLWFFSLSTVHSRCVFLLFFMIIFFCSFISVIIFFAQSFCVRATVVFCYWYSCIGHCSKASYIIIVVSVVYIVMNTRTVEKLIYKKRKYWQIHFLILLHFFSFFFYVKQSIQLFQYFIIRRHHCYCFCCCWFFRFFFVFAVCVMFSTISW